MNIKHKVTLKIQHHSTDIFSNQTLKELRHCLFWFIQMEMTMLKDLQLEDITNQKVLLRILMSSSIERTFMTNQMILM